MPSASEEKPPDVGGLGPDAFERLEMQIGTEGEYDVQEGPGRFAYV